MNIKTLIKNLKKGEESAFKQLVFSYSKRLLTISKIYAHGDEDAKDILQESFIIVFKKVKNFKGDEEGALLAWIRQIIIYQAMNKRQKKYMTLEKSVESYTVEPSIDSDAISRLSHDEIVDLVLQLPAGYKQVFGLYAIEGFSHKEIADRMGIKESSSRSQYVRAKKILQQKVNELSKIRI